MTFAVLSVVGVLASGLVAAPGQTCADTVLSDWYDDGAIQGTYDAACYRDALRTLPDDVRVYTTAVDDLSRALRRTVARDEAEQPADGSARSLSGVRKTQSREPAEARRAGGGAGGGGGAPPAARRAASAASGRRARASRGGRGSRWRTSGRPGACPCRCCCSSRSRSYSLPVQPPRPCCAGLGATRSSST